MNADPKYYSADDVTAFRAQAEKAEKQSEEVVTKAAKDREDAQAPLARKPPSRSSTTTAMTRPPPTKAPWNILSVWHDAKFSYIEATPSEQFAVYELVDGKPTAINIFPEGNGSFRTDRVIDAGYFELGKKQLNFSR